MAKSKFEYVRQFELDDKCLPNCWIVARVDGRNFHRFADDHKFKKPNDRAALELMCKSAEAVMQDFSDVVVAYGQSDEFSFVFRKQTDLFQRRSSKLLSTLVSLFSSSYTFHWSEHFPSTPLLYPPTFDARLILYPSIQNIRDYLSWRQADCHINNLHNTCYWKLVSHSNVPPPEAQARLGKMLARDKNELLFSQYNLNYNNVEQVYRKGSTIVKEICEKESSEVDESIVDITKDKDDNNNKDKDDNNNKDKDDNNNKDKDDNNNKNKNDNNNNDENSCKEEDRQVSIDQNEQAVIEGVDQINGKLSKKKLKTKLKKDKHERQENKITSRIVTYHTDIIGDSFWNDRPYLLTE